MRSILVVAMLALLVIAGCAPKAMAPAGPTATDTAIESVSDEVTGLDALEQDMDLSDLDSLDQELADIDTLELQ